MRPACTATIRSAILDTSSRWWLDTSTPAPSSQVAHRLADDHHTRRVEGVGGFVEDHRRRCVGDRRRYAETLPVSTGQGSGSCGRPRAQCEPFDHLVSDPAGGSPVKAMQTAGEDQVLPAR